MIDKGEFHYFWSLRDKALYYALYVADPFPGAAMMGMPGSDDLTEEEALQTAKEALIGRGVAPEDIDRAVVSVNYWIEPEDAYWIFVYFDPNILEGNANVYQVNIKQDGSYGMVYVLELDGPSHG